MGMITHRHSMFELLPRWLRNTNAYSVLYTIALMADAIGDALFAAIKIRFPNFYSAESLPMLGNERRMVRGPNESAESFAARLRQWWDVAKQSGDFITIARQLAAYFLPTQAVIQIVNNRGFRYTLGTDGSWTIDHIQWDWDGNMFKWSRFWVLISNTLIGATGTDHLVLDSGADVLQPTRFVGSDYVAAAADLKVIEEMYRPPHAYCDGILILLDAEAFWATLPAGNWDYWENRSNNALYWEGTVLS